jgi:hypothetical protein
LVLNFMELLIPAIPYRHNIELVLLIESFNKLVPPVTSRYLKLEYNRSRRDDIVLSMDSRWHGNCAYLLREWSDMIEGEIS